MPLLVDGHNLIGHSPDLSLSDPHDEARLIARLKAFVTRTGKVVTVVFDPNPNDDLPHFGHSIDQHGKLKIIFAAPRHKADDVIRDIVSETKDRKGLIVITSDGAVASFTRQSGMRVQSSSDFVNEMQSALNASASFDDKPSASKSEVEAWADIFKEPEPTPKPAPAQPKLSPQELKRLRRMEQLKRQVANSRRLR